MVVVVVVVIVVVVNAVAVVPYLGFLPLQSLVVGVFLSICPPFFQTGSSSSTSVTRPGSPRKGHVCLLHVGGEQREEEGGQEELEGACVSA